MDASAGSAGETPRLRALQRAIGSGDVGEVRRLLATEPSLARCPEPVGATRLRGDDFFLPEIGHHVYAGDTALHLAAAHRPELVQLLLQHGSDPSARNRRGAEPLHYAADGAVGHTRWRPERQALVIDQLLAAGAAPDARDASGVAPLHRAVRTRSAAAVGALLAGGADPRLANGSGSTPLHLAVQGTGRGGSGTPAARAEQREIIALLRANGARPTDRDGGGRPVTDRARPAWIRELLA